MLWLECEQYIENELNVPDGDYSDQSLMILRKFFRPDSNFSLLVHVPERLRAAMLTALAEAEEKARSGSGTPSASLTAALSYPAEGLGDAARGGGAVVYAPHQSNTVTAAPVQISPTISCIERHRSGPRGR